MLCRAACDVQSRSTVEQNATNPCFPKGRTKKFGRNRAPTKLEGKTNFYIKKSVNRVVERITNRMKRFKEKNIEVFKNAQAL